ncbi:hypothetical protein EAF04_005747 [Stromatinia cepivora]|nr:hypothetical protein EAF04_005747 [Stromatinia cepivora]
MSAQSSNIVSLSVENLRSWFDHFKNLPLPPIESVLEPKTSGWMTMEEEIYYKLLQYFDEWFCWTMHTIRGDELISLRTMKPDFPRKELSQSETYPKYVIQLQEFVESKPGKSLFCSYQREDDLDEIEFSNLLEGYIRECGRYDDGFIVLGNHLQHEFLYRIYAPEGQGFPALSGQYKRDNTAREVMGGETFSTEKCFRAVVWKKVEVNNQGYNDEQKLREVVAIRRRYVAH